MKNFLLYLGGLASLLIACYPQSDTSTAETENATTSAFPTESFTDDSTSVPPATQDIVPQAGVCHRWRIEGTPLPLPENIPLPPPTYSSALEIEHLNGFWGLRSRVKADDFVVKGTRDNLINFYGTSLIAYDPLFLTTLVEKYNTTLVASFTFAHEQGHVIQATSGIRRNQFSSIAFETSADCFAGYYLGALTCLTPKQLQDNGFTFTLGKDEKGQKNFETAFNFFCEIGDPLGQTSGELHGSCESRYRAFYQGYDGYKKGIAPLRQCHPSTIGGLIASMAKGPI